MEIKITSSIISTQSIRELILFSYNTDIVKSCELLQSTMHDTYLIETFMNKYIFKVFKYNDKTKDEINFEIEFNNYLKLMKLNVSCYIKKIDDDYILSINTPEGVRYGILTTYCDGEELKYKDNDDAFEYGLNVGKLHKISKEFIPLENKKEININK